MIYLSNIVKTIHVFHCLRTRLNVFLLLSLCSGNLSAASDLDNRPVNYPVLLQEFRNPGADYRPAPLWVWNNTLSKELIEHDLKAFKEAGIGGVYIHARKGLQVEYLSDEWFKWVDYSLSVAEKLGLKVWIYDENVCPSGFSGGHVPYLMPESYNQGVGLMPRHSEILPASIDASKIPLVYRKEEGVWKNISSDYKKYTGEKGEYLYFDIKVEKSGKGGYGGFCYVDLMARGVTQKFMEVVMTGYEKVGKRHFGKLIPGIMTDEPQIAPSAGGLRYTPDLFSAFKERWGYQLEDHLPSLIEKTGDYRKIRHDYRTVLLELFIDRWSKPWYEYTEKNNLTWTGHYWENVWPDLYHGPDNMAMYAWHQMPGVDMLFNSTERRPDQFGNDIAIKELSSVRNQLGRQRAFSETYGGSGWDLDFEDMKRNGDWQYALGVNYLNMHLSDMSVVGMRKGNYPQSFMTHAPYWNLFRYPMDYFARLSVAMSSGRQENRILVMEPTTSMWMYYPDSRHKRMLDSTFRNLVTGLEKYQIEYDLGCENIISDHGKVEGKQYVIDQCRYDLVVLDKTVENLDKKTFTLLKEFLGNGGRVLQFGNALKYVDGIENHEIEDCLRSPNWIRRMSLTQEVVSSYLLDPDFYLSPSIGGRIHHQRRVMEDGDILFLANFSEKEYAGTEVVACGTAVEELCEETGECTPGDFIVRNGRVLFPVTLPPGGSALYYIHKDKKIATRPLKENKYVKISSPSSSVRRDSPNVLVLDYLSSLKVKDENCRDIFFYDANKKVFNAFGFSHNPWEDVQFKSRTMDRNNDFRKGDAFSAEYSFKVMEGTSLKGMQAVVERGQLYSVSVNGNHVRMNGSCWLDPDFKCYDIAEYVRPGENTIKISIEKFNVLCEVAPVYILGEFTLEAENAGWSIHPQRPLSTGSWFLLGAPFYQGTVTYTRTLRTEESGEYSVNLPSWKGTVAEVKVNGCHAGIIGSQPYSLSVKLGKGTNEVGVTVYGSLKNVFGPFHVETDGYLRPTSFNIGKKIQPEGKAYCLPHYGLYEDFEILKKLE